MKRILIIGGSILALLGVGYYFSKSKTTDTNKNTNSATDAAEDTETTTPKILVSEKMGLTYEGQTIYKKYKGVAATGSQIGYLIDGTLLTTSNTIYENGEYKAKKPTTPSNGGVANNILGTFLVDNTYQVVYQKREGINLSDYPNSFGFLANGSIVYSGINNPGEESETTFYHT